MCPPIEDCLRQAGDLAAGLIPGVATVHDATTLLTGRNQVTGESVGVLGRIVAFVGLVTPATGGELRAAGAMLGGGKKAVEDFLKNPGDWKRVGSFVEAATNRRARGGSSIQTIFERADGERVIEHTVVNKAGKVIDGPHPRPGFKPREGDLP